MARYLRASHRQLLNQNHEFDHRYLATAYINLTPTWNLEIPSRKGSKS